jgi:1,4-dihydroxy-6-naphthoate synthase
MLLKLFAPQCKNYLEMPFEKIIPAIHEKKVDCGVIIHESRFTYQLYNLKLIQDLGNWWEKTTGHPIPLGGIAVRRSLGAELTGKIDSLIRESIEHAFKHPEESKTYIQQYAQEMDKTVLKNHIDLYVNSFSRDLGIEGENAVIEFLEKGRKFAGLPKPSQETGLFFDSLVKL